MYRWKSTLAPHEQAADQARLHIPRNLKAGGRSVALTAPAASLLPEAVKRL